jgi:hypothetical protein
MHISTFPVLHAGLSFLLVTKDIDCEALGIGSFCEIFGLGEVCRNQSQVPHLRMRRHGQGHQLVQSQAAEMSYLPWDIL